MAEGVVGDRLEQVHDVSLHTLPKSDDGSCRGHGKQQGRGQSADKKKYSIQLLKCIYRR